MRNVVFAEKVLNRVNQYMQDYRMYFEEVYTDTGILSEWMIIERYRELALERKQSIMDAIIGRLLSDMVIGHTWNYTVNIPWRSKNLFVTW